MDKAELIKWVKDNCEPNDKTKPYMEITCMCLKDFEDFIGGIEKYIGIE